MKILLLNENPVISKLVSLSVKKMSYDFEELHTYSDDLDYYDAIVVDSDIPAPLEILKTKCERLIFLAPRNQDVDIDAQILHKPFLPTDFLNLFNSKNARENDFNQLPISNHDENFHHDLNVLDDLSHDNNINLDNDLQDLSLDEKQDSQSLMENEILEDKDLEEKDTDEYKEELTQNLDQETNNIQDKKQFIQNDDATNQLDQSDFVDIVAKEQEVDFSDIPKDAQFLGQIKENENVEALEDFVPIVVEEMQDLTQDYTTSLSAQDQIKEELAELDKLDCDKSDENVKILQDFKDESILNDKELGLSEDEVVVPKLINDFDVLAEDDIQEALGEKLLLKDEKNKNLNLVKLDDNEEIVNELSKSIAGTIASSIKDHTLRAALKGMKMNINININFNED